MTDLDEKQVQKMLQIEEKTVNKPSTDIRKNDDASYKYKIGNYAFKSKTCTYFFQNGYCKFGDNCKYSHYRERAERRKYISQSFNKQSEVPKNSLNDENALNCRTVQNADRQASFKNICRYFKAGRCDKDYCKFQHSVDLYDDQVSSVTVSPQYGKVEKNIYYASNQSFKKKSIPHCHYFKKGQCYKGDDCKYYHQKSIFNNPNNSISSSTDIADFSSPDKLQNVLTIESSTTDKPVTTFNRTLNIYDSLSLTKEEVSALRTTEVSQLKKRFPQLEVIEENKTFSFTFQPSDPDWPFDVRNLNIEAHFPENYPTEKCEISVPQSSENIPQLLIKHLNKTICDWIDKRYEESSSTNKLELVFRPFLKWFDKNLEELFICGLRKVKQDLKAKEDGIEFVPAENIFSSPREDTSSDNLNDEKSPIPNPPESQQAQASSDHKPLLPLADKSNKLPQYVGNDGVKLLFSEFELTEGAAALTCTKISVTLQCSRCKTSFNMKSIPKKNNSHNCSKCRKNVGFTFEPSTMHQFSSVLGNLHLLDCVAVDVNLVECHFLVDCLNCSKQVPVDGIHYGQRHKMWCTFCNEKMMMSAGSVKFQALRMSVSAAKYQPGKKIEKKVKDPVIKEGDPLPNFGACKHYKKSFRWLRFPCCGRIYPCDECHNEKEADHEMKYASRMICGFCAKEQPYNKEKPCLLCSQSLTKKSGSHWEGGKGCRNRIQMSKEDKQKYAGTSKTVSKKAQIVKTKKKS